MKPWIVAPIWIFYACAILYFKYQDQIGHIWGYILVALYFLMWGLVYFVAGTFILTALYWIFRLVRATCLYLESRVQR